uniref:Thioredoxin domain-containing protein n=1 Tax=Megaselia scalaris TaxID=36166 RepID=T1H7J8_MEGSC
MKVSVKSKEDFSNYLKSAGRKLVIVDFYANWCGPCKKIEGIVEELANAHSDDVIVLKVNVDECEELTDYNVSSMPQFFF